MWIVFVKDCSITESSFWRKLSVGLCINWTWKMSTRSEKRTTRSWKPFDVTKVCQVNLRADCLFILSKIITFWPLWKLFQITLDNFDVNILKFFQETWELFKGFSRKPSFPGKGSRGFLVLVRSRFQITLDNFDVNILKFFQEYWKLFKPFSRKIEAGKDSRGLLSFGLRVWGKNSLQARVKNSIKIKNIFFVFSDRQILLLPCVDLDEEFQNDLCGTAESFVSRNLQKCLKINFLYVCVCVCVVHAKIIECDFCVFFFSSWRKKTCKVSWWCWTFDLCVAV